MEVPILLLRAWGSFRISTDPKDSRIVIKFVACSIDLTQFGTEFGEGDATKQKSVKKSDVSLNEGKAFSE